MTILILGKTRLDLPLFQRTIGLACDRKVNRVADERNVTEDSRRTYITLSAFESDDYKYNIAIDTDAIDHIHYTLGFAADSDLYVHLLKLRQLMVLQSESIRRNISYYVVTSSLRGWRDSVIDASVKDSDNDLRILFNQIQDLFVLEGLSGLWSNYTKVKHNDSVLLIPQR